MFGENDQEENAGQSPQVSMPDENTQAPANGALNGVEDLASGVDNATPTDSPPSGGTSFMPAPSEPAPESNHSDHQASDHNFVNDNDLLDLKQGALQQLTPLLDHLEQTPEERFRTTMMMIQASDNKDLLQHAYDAAQAIPDDKAKAQALLDVVNEINYFTQQKALN